MSLVRNFVLQGRSSGDWMEHGKVMELVVLPEESVLSRDLFYGTIKSLKRE